MPEMSEDEWRAFLREGTRTARVATVRADGRPHVAPVWFVLDGRDLVFNTGKTSVKGTALRRDPRVAITVDDDRHPYAFVLVEGTATISEDPGEMLRWSTEIARRYMPADLAEATGRRNAVPGELLVRVTPAKVVAQRDLAS